MISTFETKVTKYEKISLSLVLIELEMVNPTQLIFKSGQYLSITLPDGKTLRSYSISSPEINKNRVELTVNIEDRSLGGAGVDYLSQLKIGDIVSMKAPFGRLDLEDTNVIIDKRLNPEVLEIMWIGTGSGIAPIKSMLEYLNYLACDVSCDDEHLRNIKNQFYVGARYSGDLCYYDEFNAITQVNPHFKFCYCLSKFQTPEDKGSISVPEACIYKGYVTDKIKQDTADYYQRDHIHVFACGKTSTIQEIRNQLCDYGFRRDNFHIENFG